MFKKFLMALVSSMALSPAFATLTFTLTESGGNVVLTASGSVNTSALTASSTTTCGSGTGGVQAVIAILCTGSGTGQGFITLTGPTSIGSGGAVLGTSTSGDNVFLGGSTGTVYLPVGYVSGSALLGTTNFTGATLTTLGVTPGTYTWTFGSGGAADSVVLIAGATVTSVPTLGEYALMALVALLVLSTLPALRRRG